MLIQQIAPVAKTEFASVFVALELSRSKWLVGVGTPQKWTVGRHQVEGGDLDGLLALLSRLGAGEEKRSGLPVKVHVCFEAGRDGHWLHRALTTAGYDVYEIDPASVAVDRRARRAKSDGVDVDKLVRTLARLVRGELDACRVVAVPSEAEEDAKRPHREYERLVKEQTAHRNRVKALLFAQGVRDFDPMASDRLERLAALPIMPRLKAELARECRRLAGIIDDIAATPGVKNPEAEIGPVHPGPRDLCTQDYGPAQARRPDIRLSGLAPRPKRGPIPPTRQTRRSGALPSGGPRPRVAVQGADAPPPLRFGPSGDGAAPTRLGLAMDFDGKSGARRRIAASKSMPDEGLIRA